VAADADGPSHLFSVALGLARLHFSLGGMRAFTVHDDVKLLDLLILDRDAVERSDWDCHHVDALSPVRADINTSHLPDDRRSMSGVELLRLAATVEQLLGGAFSGYLDRADDPWLTIKSIRGMYFVVITSSDSLVAALQERCHDVRESPEDIGYVA
jgi:hypothetical protein